MKAEMTMRRNLMIFAAMGSVLLPAISCVKEKSNDEKYRPAGTEIPFTAATSFANGEETRAEYSGVLYETSPKYERINWSSGDPITIEYSNGSSTVSSTYTVSTYETNSTDSKRSDATISSSNPLVWDGRGTSHTFYGLYPASSRNSNSTINGATVTGSIPASQPVNASKTLPVTESNVTYNKYQPDTENYGYMVAYKQINQSSTEGNVLLPFRPAFTTFEFKFQRKSGDSEVNVASFVLTSESGANGSDLTGDFQFDITGVDGNDRTLIGTVSKPTGGTRGRSITVSFPQGGVALPSTGYLDFSMLALPIDQKGLTLTINYVNGTPAAKHIRFKTNNNTEWRTFTGGKKYIITNVEVPGAGWTYSIEDIDDQTVYGGASATTFTTINVNSVKTSQTTPAQSSTVGWKVQYKNGNNWYDIDDSNHPLSSYASYASVSTTSTTLTVSYAAESSNSATVDNTISPFEAAKRILQSRPARSDYDLSKHKIDGTSISMTTANCYVVTAPGTYKFPCVYGNAIKGGSNNPSAYSPSTATNTLSEAKRPDLSTNMSQLKNVETYWDVDSQKRVYYLPNFLNAWNAEIRYPNIYTDTNQGVEGDGICSAELLWSQNSTNINLDSSLSDEGGYKYITFSISKTTIQPDNMVIAMIDEDDETIVWSWHIWVTDKNLAAANNAMPYNLGWIDSDKSPVSGAVTKYPDRELTLKIVQTEGNLESGPFTFKRLGDIVSINESLTSGNNPHYQWGRKDPIKYVNGYSSEAVYQQLNDANNEHVGFGIKKPAKLAVNTTNMPWSTSWLGGPVYPACNVGYYVYQAPGMANPNGPFTYAQVVDFVNNQGFSASYFSWRDDYYTLTVGGQVYGPFDYATKQASMVNYPSGWSAAFTTPISTAVQRREGSIPSNLWNSYIYKEGALNSAVNKFKTVYDPCPVGFTVPTADYYLGAAVSNTTFTETNGVKEVATSVSGLGDYKKSGARQFHATNGSIDNNMIVRDEGTYGFYWTDHPLSITLNNSSYPDQLSSYLYYNDAYYLQVTSGGTNVRSIPRGTAASIRPMVDPKF